MLTISALEPSQLSAKPSRRVINQALTDPEALTASFIGQSRARKALDFGLGIQAQGYNLYVMGEPATGRYTLVHEHIRRHVEKLTTPDEWCYLNNFDEEREPVALKMAPGESKKLVDHIDAMIEEVLATFPAAFDNPGYQRKKAAIKRSFDQKYADAIDKLETFAQQHDVALYEDEGTISFSPIVNGKPLKDDEFSQLEEQQRQHFYDLISELETRLTDQLVELPQWNREMSEMHRQLKRETAEQGIKPLIKHLEHVYAGDLGVLKFLRQMRENLIETVIELLDEENSKEDKNDDLDRKTLLTEQVQPNVLVASEPGAGAPVIYEPNPTYQNLFGRIEYTNISGSVYTSYRMIRPGALHRANGGYLLLDIDKLIQHPYVWETLKLVLKRGELKMDLPQMEVGMVNSMTLNPQAIPIKLKVVLMGSRDLFYTLQEYDDEFDQYFRVLVDFDHEIPLENQNLYDFVGKVREQIDKIQLDGITQKATYRLVEHSLRLAEHQHRLSARFSDTLELINEAAYFCQLAQSNTLDLVHIEQALSAKTERNGRISEGLLEDIKEGQILISTEGVAVGKVNGLTVLDIGDSVFGTPARITATVYAGANGVVDIEREVELGRSIHSKGVMLLTGYLGNKYAQGFPLTLSANIALEQNYGHIDGDSASLGELVALLSALTGVAVKQEIAVTGSINQYGQVQSVGGINEKIEGFFRLCQHRGLTGQQGVIIPKSNTCNLMLDKEIIAAVKQQRFHIYAVDNVDQAVQIMTGLNAGEVNKRGRYPKQSLNQIALDRLSQIAGIVNGTEEDD